MKYIPLTLTFFLHEIDIFSSQSKLILLYCKKKIGQYRLELHRTCPGKNEYVRDSALIHWDRDRGMKIKHDVKILLSCKGGFLIF